MNGIDIAAEDLYVLSAAAVFWLLCSRLVRHLKEPAADAVRMLSNVLAPLLVIFWLCDQVLNISRDSFVLKAESTVLGIVALWAFALTCKALYLRNADENSFRGRTPRLLLGIFSLFFVVIGGLCVFAAVWKKDLSPLLTTFGVGSLVFGLALQDTLGNLFAGLALVFDRPFQVGDWVQIGDVIGRVKQIDWRSVRVITRELNEITLPNVTLGKERILNFSSPSPLHGMRINIGFSYDAPPNLVRQMLTEVALATPGVVPDPYPDIRTHNYGAYTIDYESFFFISDYGPLNRIRSDFMSRVWYAAKRYGISIPFPIHTVYKTEVPAVAADLKRDLGVYDLVRRADLFRSLLDDECRQIVEGARIEHFAKSEFLFKEGDEGNFLYVFISGQADIQITGEGGQPVSLTTLGPGDVIGEMALFTGEARKASAQALMDVRVARVGKEAIAGLLESREELINAFVASMSARLKQADEVRERHRAALAEEQVRLKVDENALRQRIRRFFGL